MMIRSTQQTLSRTFGMIGLYLFLGPVLSGFSMTMNLAMPWSDRCSPPQSPYLVFDSPQSDDLLFDTGDQLELRCQAGLRSVALRWTLHRNRIETPFREGSAEALTGNRFVIRVATAELIPGFYDLRVELDTGLVNESSKDALLRRPVQGICTFGWRADRMAVAETRPADFAVFWANAKASLVKIPLDAKEGSLTVFGPEAINVYNVAHACLPPDYDPEGHRAERVVSQKVDFAGPDGGRVYGWLAKPEGQGRFPAMLVLPGAGFAARPRPLEHARHGYVALDIQVHGQDVDLESYPALPGYADHAVYEPASAFYYYRVHQRCLQALNYLVSRPDVDPARIAVVGGSQGGRLSLVTAGLDSRVKAVVASIPHAANDPYLSWAARCNGYVPNEWPPKKEPMYKPVDGMAITGEPPVNDSAAGRCFVYYDPMNAAPDIRCPVMMNAGLIDPISPPCGVWAVYNRVGTEEKQIVVLDGLAHDWSAGFDRRAWRWLERVLSRE